MSSARKRSNLNKAYAEIDHLKQQAMLTEFHYSTLKHVAEVIAAKFDAMSRLCRPVMEAHAEPAILNHFYVMAGKTQALKGED